MSHPFAKVDQLDDATLETLVQRFEARGRYPPFVRMLDEYLDAMPALQSAFAKVLDLGCGTGLVSRAIMRRRGFGGAVTGVDRSAYLVAAAARLAAAEGVGDRVQFCTGDAHRLDFADASFDAVVAHTLLSHVDDPPAVLTQAARVLVPGGMLAIFDGDYASLTFELADAGASATWDRRLIDALVAQPRVLRRLPRLLPAAGFVITTTFSNVLTEVGRADFWSSGIEMFRNLLAQSADVSAEEADAWAAALRSDSEAGLFFGRCNYHTYLARRL